MIFAREIHPTLTSLVKKVDQETGKNAAKEMGSFVVFCNDNPSLGEQLKQLAEKEKLKDLILGIDDPAGPKGYLIAPEADVTVVLYTQRKVVANFAFKKGELKAADVEKILKDIAKILE